MNRDNNKFQRFSQKQEAGVKTSQGVRYVDYKDTDSLKRMLTPNGKIHGRKRTQLDSQGQKLVAQAVKRARYMALLPYTSATV